jgi:hypothetical protein
MPPAPRLITSSRLVRGGSLASDVVWARLDRCVTLIGVRLRNARVKKKGGEPGSPPLFALVY